MKISKKIIYNVAILAASMPSTCQGMDAFLQQEAKATNAAAVTAAALQFANSNTARDYLTHNPLAATYAGRADLTTVPQQDIGRGDTASPQGAPWNKSATTHWQQNQQFTTLNIDGSTPHARFTQEQIAAQAAKQNAYVYSKAAELGVILPDLSAPHHASLKCLVHELIAKSTPATDALIRTGLQYIKAAATSSYGENSAFAHLARDIYALISDERTHPSVLEAVARMSGSTTEPAAALQYCILDSIVKNHELLASKPPASIRLEAKSDLQTLAAAQQALNKNNMIEATTLLCPLLNDSRRTYLRCHGVNFDSASNTRWQPTVLGQPISTEQQAHVAAFFKQLGTKAQSVHSGLKALSHEAQLLCEGSSQSTTVATYNALKKEFERQVTLLHENPTERTRALSHTLFNFVTAGDALSSIHSFADLAHNPQVITAWLYELQRRHIPIIPLIENAGVIAKTWLSQFQTASSLERHEMLGRLHADLLFDFVVVPSVATTVGSAVLAEAQGVTALFNNTARHTMGTVRKLQAAATFAVEQKGYTAAAGAEIVKLLTSADKFIELSAVVTPEAAVAAEATLISSLPVESQAVGHVVVEEMKAIQAREMAGAAYAATAGRTQEVETAVEPTAENCYNPDNCFRISQFVEAPSIDVWDMNPRGSIINGRKYTRHALERMAPDTATVREELAARALQKGYVAGSSDYIKYINPRNIPPSVIEHIIQTVTPVDGKTLATLDYITSEMKITTNINGDVVTIHRYKKMGMK